MSSNWEARFVLDASSISTNNSKEDWSPCRGIQSVTLRRLRPSKTLTSSRFTTGISVPCLASTETTVLTGTVPDADCCADQDDMPQLNPISSLRIVDNAVCLHFMRAPFARSRESEVQEFASPHSFTISGKSIPTCP